MFVAKEREFSVNDDPHPAVSSSAVYEEPGVIAGDGSRITHRRSPSFGEFFSSSSRWLVDQFARTTFNNNNTQTKQYDPLSESSGGGEDSNNGEDFFSWLLPGSSSPQEFGEGEACNGMLLAQFSLDPEPALMYKVGDEDVEQMTLSPLCEESDDEEVTNDSGYEWTLQLASSFKERFSSWKFHLQQSLASLDCFILKGAHRSDPLFGDRRPQEFFVNPAAFDLDFDEELDGTFSCSSLAQRAMAFWQDTVIAGIPQKIEEIRKASAALYTESVAEMQASNSCSSTFDRVRTQSLLRAYRTFNEKSNSLLDIFGQLTQQDIQPLVREAYEEAVRTSGPSIYQASKIPLRAAQNVKNRVSSLLDGLISNLEATEKEMDGALQQVLFVLRSQEEDKRKEDVRAHHGEEIGLYDATRTEKPSRKRRRETPLSVVSDSFRVFDEATMSNLFSSSTWEEFFSTTVDIPAQYLQLEKHLLDASLGFCEVKSDGNCQFRALAHQIYGTEDAHSIVRALVVREISNNPQRYQRFMGSHEKLQNYLTVIAEQNQRGDCITLFAVANLYCVDIFLFTPLLQEPLLISPQYGPRQKILYLTYINDNHYQSLMKETVYCTETTKPIPHPAKKSKRASALERQLVDNLKLLQISHVDFSLLPEYLQTESSQLIDSVQMEPPLTGQIALDDSGSLSPQEIPAAPSPSPRRVSRSSPPSLLQVCLARVADAIDSFPALETILPEDLLQKLIKLLVAMGKLNDYVLPRLLTPSFHTLHLPKCKKLTDAGFATITATCTNLKEIDLSGCVNLRGSSLVGIGCMCPSLRFLDLEGCTGIPASTISDIAKTCTGLVSLNLSGTYITDSALCQVLLFCKNLSRLQIRNCTQITDAGLTGLGPQVEYLDLSDCAVTDKTLLRIASSCPDLKLLKLSSCHITDPYVERLCIACPRLSVLSLNSCDLISDATVHTIARHCLSLQVLSLSYCKRITDDAFVKPPSSPEHDFLALHSLDLARCINVSNSSLKQIALRCPNLRTLNLSSCEDITDEAVVAMADICSLLEDLDLSKCVNITDVSITAIAQRCKNLRRLCLYNCVNITDSSMSQLASQCHSISSLDLSSCENITDSALISLSKGCPSLSILSLEECQRITDLGIGSLAEGCPELHTLRLAYCKGITDLSLQVLSEACPLILSIDFSYCLNLTLTGIQQAIDRWSHLIALSLRGNSCISSEALQHPTLQSLNLSWCKNLEDRSIAFIAKGCPGLQNLDLSWCSRLEGNHLGDLSRFCSQLRSINLKGCNRISSTTIKAFASECKIKVYH